jgi:exopolysaccharide biosynthesis protein
MASRSFLPISNKAFMKKLSPRRMVLLPAVFLALALSSCAILKNASSTAASSATSSPASSTVVSSSAAFSESPSSPAASSSTHPNDHNAELVSSSVTATTIKVTTNTIKNSNNVSTKYFIVDISLKRLTDLRTHLETSNGYPGTNITATPTKQISQVKSETGETVLAAINGDMPYFSGKTGYVIRNGTTVRSSYRSGDDAANQDYAVYYDGTVDSFMENGISTSDLITDGCYQSWEFGPTLMANGSLTVDENSIISSQSSSSNERTAIGLIAPLHFVFFMSQGRLVNNDGFSLYEEATILKNYGCVSAYNLDGGGSSYVYANSSKLNASSENERAVNDILYVVNS